MTSTRDLDLLDTVRWADPLRDALVGAASDADRLLGARRVLGARVGHPTEPISRPFLRRPSWWRRVALVTAVLTALPIGATVVVPDVMTRLGLRWLTDQVTGSATAGGGAESGLPCGTGHAQAIRPDRAPLRLWPTDLPDGVRVTTVFARSTSFTGWCTDPSLVLAELTPDGTVRGSLAVIGPGRDIQQDGEPERLLDRVAGLPAVRIGYPGMQSPDFQRWVVTDRDLNEWEVVVIGYPAGVARTMADGLSFRGTDVSWSGRDQRLTLLHRRTGRPYPTSTSGGLDWYVRLSDGRSLEIQTSPNRRQAGLFGDGVAPGTRVYHLGGRPTHAWVEGGITRSVAVEVSPGVRAFMEVRGDLPAVERMLTSLVDLDPDDPRLDDLALDEDVEP